MSTCAMMSWWLCVLVALATVAANRKFPEFIQRCPFSGDGAALGECIRTTYLKHRDAFIAGVPELHVPPLDPFHVPRIDFNTGNGSSVGIAAVFTDVAILGTREADLRRVYIDLAGERALLDVHFDLLRMRSRYTISGRIMVLPINGTGNAVGNFTDVHATVELTGTLVPRHGKDYVEWKDRKLSLSIGRAYMHFDDLFNGNAELTETTNRVINDNSAEIVRELTPLVQETISTITFTLLQQVFHAYSLDELFYRN